MAHISADRVKETTTTVGAGAVTLLGAASGFLAFSAVMANADTCWYCIAGGAEWEVGLGTWGTGGILTRTTVLHSSNANTAVTFSAGTKDVFLTVPADKLLQAAADGSMLMVGSTTDPTALPPAGSLKLYAKNIGGRIMPKWVGPSGVDTPIQPFLGMNHIRMALPGNGAGNTAALAVSAYGIGFLGAGTSAVFAQNAVATGSLKSKTRLATVSTAATANAQAYLKGTNLEVARETGFYFVARFGLQTINATNSFFFGLYGSATAPAVSFNAVTTVTTAKIGIAANVNTGNLQITIGNGTAATTVDLGANFPVNATDLYELVIFSAPGAATMQYRVTNMTTGNTTGVVEFTMTNAPATTLYMTPLYYAGNIATASAAAFAFKQLYLETDF